MHKDRRLFKKDVQSEDDDQDEENKNQEQEEEGDEEKEETEVSKSKAEPCSETPETDFRLLEPSQTLPLNCFLILRGRGKRESRKWQLAQYLGKAEGEEEVVNVRFWGCEEENEDDQLHALYRPAFGLTHGGGWKDVYVAQPRAKPSISTAVLKELFAAYAVSPTKVQAGRHVLPEVVQSMIKDQIAKKAKPKAKRRLKRKEKTESSGSSSRHKTKRQKCH